ncbi:MAG: hypothetical protein J6X55_00110 [Victivallales bacterium]|nr:hypothetical protein [Victivallales bacterium]
MSKELFNKANAGVHEFPRILAHRGMRDVYTENGIMAFQYALDHGLTGFETDFRMTADGVIVVMHDSDIKRTTTGEGVIEKMTLAQLKQVKLNNSDETVPTADELLSLFDNRKDFYIELEMKARYGELYSTERMDDYLKKLHAIAEKHLSKGFYLLTCFDHDVLRHAKELFPEVNTGLICGGLRQEDIDAAINLGCFGLSPTFEGTDQALVEKAIAAGLAINLWHSETLDLWKEAKARGAVVSTNNHPVDVLQAIKANGLY